MQAIDGTTVQFAWDPPLNVDEVNIRGYLKAYQVIFISNILCCMNDVCVCRLKCFDGMIQRVRFVLFRIFRRIKHGQLFSMRHQMVTLQREFELKLNDILDRPVMLYVFILFQRERERERDY